jgi:hypothetical protein
MRRNDMIAHGLNLNCDIYTICGLNTDSHSCNTILDKNTSLCNNCRKVLGSLNINMGFEGYGLWYRHDTLDLPIYNWDCVKLEAAKITIYGRDGICRIVMRNTYYSGPTRLPILDSVDATLLWLSSEYFSVPLDTFVESIISGKYEATA